MIVDEVREELFRLQDAAYREFQLGVMPTVDASTVIGVRTPALRKLAKQLGRRDDVDVFLSDLPHTYFDENQLHAFIVSEVRDYAACVAEVEQFLPYVDNWATCDQMSPRVFKRHRAELLEPIKHWIASDETYTMRFGVGMLMEHYLDEDFDPIYLDMVAGVTSDEYYVRMMVAWYFATALAKQYDAAIPYLTERRLDGWTHNKTIQKAIESRRISAEQKDYLRSLRVKLPRETKPSGIR
ncbi:MAG: DNA alkylation repair protein [Atopobiaceae bacterium]|nr:DNA alkylation repair protein [Atopobiaceae bacterium]